MLHTRYAPALLLAAALTPACTLQSTEPPLPTGPSELSLSLSITATPDVIAQDGGSQALITIIARDANGQPVPGVSLMVQTAVNGMLVDYGTLSAKSLVTDGQGRATVVYTAPPAPPATQTSDVEVRIVVTPIGSNYDNSMSRDIGIRLSRPGVILPPNNAPQPVFTFAPTSPAAGQEVAFDASDSRDPDGRIVRYEWNWGDGDFESTTNPIIQKDYERSGTFTVRLTVVDDGGLRASTSQTVSVGTNPRPTASFTFSPAAPAPGAVVNFNATESTAPEGRAIVQYRWNFGDGSAEVTSSSRTTQHAFDREGDFVVTLTVTDSEGQTHTVSQTVTVEI
ncbi:MAG: PKD domain-containing protein [Acidobacteriota bacterium]|nr:PKD domain-containing protein [Acidobacteriota bacterium]